MKKERRRTFPLKKRFQTADPGLPPGGKEHRLTRKDIEGEGPESTTPTCEVPETLVREHAQALIRKPRGVGVPRGRTPLSNLVPRRIELPRGRRPQS